MPKLETFEEQVIRMLNQILKRLDEIERQMPNPRDFPDYPDRM